MEFKLIRSSYSFMYMLSLTTASFTAFGMDQQALGAGGAGEIVKSCKNSGDKKKQDNVSYSLAYKALVYILFNRYDIDIDLIKISHLSKEFNKLFKSALQNRWDYLKARGRYSIPNIISRIEKCKNSEDSSDEEYNETDIIDIKIRNYLGIEPKPPKSPKKQNTSDVSYKDFRWLHQDLNLYAKKPLRNKSKTINITNPYILLKSDEKFKNRADLILAYWPQLRRSLIDLSEGGILVGHVFNEDEILRLGLRNIAFSRYRDTATIEEILGFLKDPKIRIVLNGALIQSLLLKNKTEYIKMLLLAGADVNYKTSTGSTPLMFTRNQDCLDLLLRWGAKIDAINKGGQTALIVAAESNEIEKVKYLIRSGANVNISDRFNRTAFTYAQERRFTEIAHVLLAAGADGSLNADEEIDTCPVQ